MTGGSTRRPSLEKSWGAFYRRICESLNSDTSFSGWLKKHHGRAQLRSEFDSGIWSRCFPDHHAAVLQHRVAPLDSLGILVAVRLPPPQVFRFIFPWPWGEFRELRAPFSRLHLSESGWFPDRQLIRHIHTQMNFSFGELTPEYSDSIPIYNSLMRASFESGNTVHCCDVFHKLDTDSPGVIYKLQSGDSTVGFRSTDQRAQEVFGLRTVVYVPCHYNSLATDFLRGFCIALYSPVPHLFGAHESEFEIMEPPDWVDNLRANPLLETLYDALLACDDAGRFTARAIFSSLFRNNLRRAEEVVHRIDNLSGLSEAYKADIRNILIHDFVENPHISIFKFHDYSSEIEGLGKKDLAVILSYLGMSSRSSGIPVRIQGFALQLADAGPFAPTQLPESMGTQAERLLILLKAYIDNANLHGGGAAIDIAVQLDDQTGRCCVDVSNDTEYPEDLDAPEILERYWWTREGLTPPGSKSTSGSGGTQLFLILTLCRGSGFEPDFFLDVPRDNAATARWHSRVFFDVLR